MGKKGTIPLTISTSSAIAAHGYDGASRTLEIQMRGGATYQYSDVPPDVYAKLKGAESLGKFFQANIKGKYTHAKLDGAS